ncbi:MAG TPA: phage portal protein [Nitrobacter sp.]|nr:phage portal protein [Nitrobacter sp.]
MKFELFGREFKFERKSLSDPGDLEFSIFTRGSSGLEVQAVANAVRLISEGAATLDIDVIKRGTADKTDHPALALLRSEANPWTSGYELIRDLTAQACIYDAGGLAWVNRVSGKPVEIIRYDAGTITVQYASDGSGEPTYSINGTAVDAANIVHVRGPFSRSPVNLASNAIATAAAMEKHAKHQFENGAKPSAVVAFQRGMSEQAIKNAKAGFNTAYAGVQNAGKIVYLYDGATFTPSEISSVDAQFLELRRFQTEEIARAFNMSPSMLGDLTKSSYANQEQKAKEFLSYCLEPWLCALESAFNRALLSDDERATLTFRFDRDDLSRVDLATRANAINSLIASTVLSPNQGASWISMPPHEGGDVFENKNVTVKQIPTGAQNVE